ncbi:MAG: hypothetical protein HY757_05395 [Nitrospirae bacterium]|nr:hypothetical protein [Nitrospirota bacterium]
MIKECVKEGFNLANKNLHLVFIQIIVSLINLVSLFIFIGLPLIAAILYLGFDLTQAKDMMPSLMTDPIEFITKYIWVVVLIGTSFLFHLIFRSVISLYTLGGTLGVLKDSAVNIQYKFSLSSFYKEAKINFSPLLWLLSLVFLAIIIFFIGFIITGGILSALVSVITEPESTLEIFLSSFSLMTIIVFSIVIGVAGLVFGVYSIVVLVTDGKSVMDSISGTFDFLKRTPGAVLFYLILIVGFITVNAVFYGIQILVSVIPFIIPLVYIMNAFFQGYLAIALWSSLIVYYVKNTNHPVYSTGYEI